MTSAIIDWVQGFWAIIRRELLSLFVTPLAYLVGALFLLNQGWNFALLLHFLNDPLAAAGPVMQFYFGGSFFIFWLPIIFMCSVLSMRVIAEERRSGTLESLLTAPLLPSQIIVGKYLGVLLFYVLLWLPTGVFYLMLLAANGGILAAGPEPGPILSGYLGTLFVGASFLSIGVLASSFVRSQLAAAVVTFVICTILLLSGLLVEQVEVDILSNALQWANLLVMMQEMAQGIVDGRWFFFHAGLSASCLTMARLSIDSRRSGQEKVRSVAICVAVLSASVFLGRHVERGDWTAGKVYSLSDRARILLADLQRPIEVVVAIPASIGADRPNPLRGELHEVLTRMAGVSSALRVHMIDPDKDRQEAERRIDDFGLSGRELADGVVMIRSGQGAQLRRSHLLPRDLVSYATGPEVQAQGPRVKAFRGEEALLSSFIEVTRESKIRICYTQGHDEPDFESLEPYGGYANLRSLIRTANLEIHRADLSRNDGLNECQLLLVAGPQLTLNSTEVARIRAFAERGGDILALVGAVVVRGLSTLSEHGLESLFAEYGITSGRRVVLDPHTMAGDSPLLSFTLSSGWEDHPASRSLIGHPISLQLVRELNISAPAQSLLKTGELAWAESDLQAMQLGHSLAYTENVDRMGPLVVAAASERSGSRLVVISSDQFALNARLRDDVVYDYGRDFILNSIAWLTQQDELLGIRAREREHIKLVLLPEQLQRMTLICLLGLPGFPTVLGALVLWRRRR